MAYSTPAYYYQPVEHPRDRRGFQGQPYTSTSFPSQLPRRTRSLPRARSPLPFRGQHRPRAAAAAAASTSASARAVPVPSSRGRRRAEYAQRTAQNVFTFAMARYMEQQRRQAGESSHSNANSHNNNTTNAHETSHHQSHASSAVGHAVTGVLLEQLIQEILEYLIRHNFFRRRRSTSTSGRGGQTDHHRQIDTGTQTSQQSSTSTEQRRRHRRQRHSEVMMTSLDRVSTELEATYDTLMRVLREPNPAMDETLRENATDLRRAITRCMARVESVQTRNRRSRRARGSVRVSRESTGRN